MFKLAYNPTDAPVPIDTAGRTLGGREWGAVSSTADETKAAIDGGRLVYVDLDDTTDAAPAAVAARERVDELTQRSQAFSALEPAQLAELAAGRAPEGATKTQLVELLTYSDVPVPAKRRGGSEGNAR